MRRFVWISALLLLLAGAGAVIGARIGTRDEPGAVHDARPDRPLLGVEREALSVGGRFVLWAVPLRRDSSSLANAWEIVHPDLKKQCGCTRKQWLRQPFVVPFPVRDLTTATFKTAETSDDRIVFYTWLESQDGRAPGGRLFFLGLKAEGSGANKRWLVDYWAPPPSIPPPLTTPG